MSLLVTGLTLATLTLAQPPASPGQPPPTKPREGSVEKTPRRPNPLAPSLPETTDAEEEEFDRIIDRFIEADIGKMRGPGAKQAVADFQRLPPEATFALIRGLNKSAKIDHSCPAVTIAKKLAGTLRTTRDPMLLDYARENIGSGIERSRHMAVLKDLKVTASARKGALDREPPPSIGGSRDHP
jgi:hypothetical protein